MKTPKEKAKELVGRYYEVDGDSIYDGITWGMAKECALKCVDETIEALEHHTWQNQDWIGFYKEVKQEIEK
jgi:hypothetical protein